MVSRRYYEYTRPNGMVHRSDLYEKIAAYIEVDWPDVTHIDEYSNLGRTDYYINDTVVATVWNVYK